jgi:hypothetical protein
MTMSMMMLRNAQDGGTRSRSRYGDACTERAYDEVAKNDLVLDIFAQLLNDLYVLASICQKLLPAHAFH